MESDYTETEGDTLKDTERETDFREPPGWDWCTPKHTFGNIQGKGKKHPVTFKHKGMFEKPRVLAILASLHTIKRHKWTQEPIWGFSGAPPREGVRNSKRSQSRHPAPGVQQQIPIGNCDVWATLPRQFSKISRFFTNCTQAIRSWPVRPSRDPPPGQRPGLEPADS